MYESFMSGKLTRLVQLDPESDAKLLSGWSLDSEYARYMDATPVRPLPRGNPPDWAIGHTGFLFIIRTLDEDKPIGLVELDGIAWSHGEAWLAIGIGNRDYWGKGYGADAMQIVMRYAFAELNLHRLSLNAFEYNTRAIHLYEKLGFRHEGTKRQFFQREGRRWDLLYMGILKPEWEKLYESQA